MLRFRHVAVMAAALVVAGCAVPRGAGFEAEVLAAASGEKAETANFQVVRVGPETSAMIGSWPQLGSQAHNWIGRVQQPASYLLAPGDIVNVSVWDTDDNGLLTGVGGRIAQLQGAKIATDGTIFLPFVGDVRVTGMSESRVRERIEELYSDTIPSAQVQITVEPGRVNTVNFVSGVGAPGIYPLSDRDVSLLTAVSVAGGISPSFENPRIKLFRGSHVYTTTVDALFDNPRLDTTLVGGDRIIVEDDDRQFLSLGAAGAEAIHPFTQDEISALEALSIIGGVEDGRANPKGILVLREYPSSALRADASGPNKSDVVFALDLTTADGLFSARNFQLADGDLVYVTESPVTTAQTVLGLLGSVVGLSNNLQ